MRIAVWHNLPAGGAKRALHDHVSGLLERGHEVEAWCPSTSDREFLPLGDLVVEDVLPLRESQFFPTRPHRLREPFASGRRRAALVRHAQRCAAAIDAARYEVVLVSTCRFFAAPPLGRFLKTPSVLYLQEPRRQHYEYPGFPWLPVQEPRRLREVIAYPARVALDRLRLHQRRHEAQFEVTNARSFDKVLVNSFFSRESVVRIYGIDASVCYLGVDTDRFRPSSSGRRDTVVGVGRVSGPKNLALLIEAVARLPATRPAVRWIGYASRDRYRRDMIELARELGVDFRLELGISDDSLRDLLGSAVALVFTPRLEPFGLAPLEANACGTPVIATHEGGVRETVIHDVNGLVAQPNPVAIAGAIQRLRDDPHLVEDLGRRGRQIVEEQWSSELAAERLEHHLFAVAKGGAADTQSDPEGATAPS